MNALITTLALCLAAPTPKEAELQKKLEAIHAAQMTNDVTKAGTLTKELLPSDQRITAVLKPDAPAELVAGVLKMHAQLGTAPVPKLAGLLNHKPEQSEIHAYGATTEEIAAYAKGGKAFEEFPGATQDLARTLLKPGVTWYEAEFVKPGEKAGMKFHLFFEDAKGWAMLGPVWRAVKK